MTCKEFEKRIPDFIDRKMDYPNLKIFLGHMDSCENCREELSISFLVADGLLHLEEGDSFDFQRELDNRLEEADRQLRRNERFMNAGFWAEIVAIGILAGILAWLVI